MAAKIFVDKAGNPVSKVRSWPLVEEGLPGLEAAMRAAKIDNPRRIAAFLTTLAFESRWEYSVPQAGATGVYKGRGYIQLTGNANYEAAGKYLKVDLLGNPELALSKDWSAKIATWYWTVTRPRTNEYADTLQMGRVNAMIGYPVGPSDNTRCKAFSEALRALTGTVPTGVTCTRTAAPTPPPVVPPPAPAWSSSERLGQWAVDGYLVNNNIWNADEAGTQTITATGPGGSTTGTTGSCHQRTPPKPPPSRSTGRATRHGGAP
jgi:hypothetical protein